MKMVVKNQNRLPRGMVKSPSLVFFKRSVTMALSGRLGSDGICVECINHHFYSMSSILQPIDFFYGTQTHAKHCGPAVTVKH